MVAAVARDGLTAVTRDDAFFSPAAHHRTTQQNPYRRHALPEEVITDKHPAYVRAVRDEVPGATHTQSGLHRRRGPDTKSIERSHVPTKDRLRPMRGLQSIRTGQRAIEGVELARAVQRGHVAAPGTAPGGEVGPHARARAAATTFAWLAEGLRVAA
jgi:hypothetical protein